jgi:[ribosomal protein S5]-alanine N-acetyltransferase
MDNLGRDVNLEATGARMESPDETSPAWRMELPVLQARRITLREPRHDDAAALFALLSNDDVSRFISLPPESVDAFERYILWAQKKRAAGLGVCFAIVPRGTDTPIGLIYLRALGPGFGTADWGFVLGSEFWGKGIFTEAAEAVLDFAFDVLRAHRMEARAALCNGRGNGALKKLGAEREGILRHAFFRNGDYLDQVLWSILHEDWQKRRQEKAAWGSNVVH